MPKVTVPELGEGIEEALVSTWLVSEGDSVKEGDDIVEMATDKATFNVPTPATGFLKKILCAEGDTVRIGQAIAELET